MPTLIYHSTIRNPTGWRYLWAKHVTGFYSPVHCARCLKGEYLNQFGKDMLANRPVELDVPAGQFIYVCGVSNPYRWPNNLHLAAVVKPGATAEVEAYHGDRVVIEGAERYEFDDREARRLFPERGEAFLTCRNFQFAAQVWGRPA